MNSKYPGYSFCQLQNTKNSPVILPQCHSHQLSEIVQQAKHIKAGLKICKEAFNVSAPTTGESIHQLCRRPLYVSQCLLQHWTSLSCLSYHLPHVCKIYTASRPLSTIWRAKSSCLLSTPTRQWNLLLPHSSLSLLGEHCSDFFSLWYYISHHYQPSTFARSITHTQYSVNMFTKITFQPWSEFNAYQEVL